jgi:hypothetical protein
MGALRRSSPWLVSQDSEEPDMLEPKLSTPFLRRWMLEATIRRSPVVCLLKVAFRTNLSRRRSATA